MSMPTYIGTKLVKATPMTRLDYNEYRGWQIPQDENGEDAGYLVEYLDGGQPNHPAHAGYISWSPAEPFAKAYRKTDGMTFGLALEALKAGQRLTRSGWNGKGMWLQHWKPMHDVDLPHIMLMYPVNSAAYPQGARVPWAPSQTDMLAEDWQIVS